MEILMVINPVSGDKEKVGLLKKLRKHLTSKDNVKLYKTTGKDDKNQIITCLKKATYDRILVAGGDGTIKLIAECLQAFKNPTIKLGILPAGSANGLARDLNLPENPEDFIPIALGNKTRKIDAIQINKELGLHISDFGLNAELIKEFSNSYFRGKLGYMINSVPTLLQNQGPYTFRVETTKEDFEVEAIMLALANSKKFGTGAVVNPDAKIDDGVFELLVFKKFDIIEILKTLNEGTEMSSDFVEIIKVKEAKITTNTPVSFQIDGEYSDDLTSVNAKILPHLLQIAVG